MLSEIKLENNLISEYDLEIIYGKDNQLKNIPVSAYSTTNGFIVGTTWKPSFIIVDKTSDNNKFQYSVTGIVEWRFLGAIVYTQMKSYKGFAFTDPFKKTKSSSSL